MPIFGDDNAKTDLSGLAIGSTGQVVAAEEQGGCANTSTNNARDEICSDDICEYCEGCSTMPSCKDYSEFKGRKLSPVA